MMRDNKDIDALRRRFLAICRQGNQHRAIRFQMEIARLISVTASVRKIRTICGLDTAYSTNSSGVYAAAIVQSYPALRILEEVRLRGEVHFPYIPGLFAFREGPIILRLLSKIGIPIDLLLLDGHGMAHPRGAGLASIIGLMAQVPSIGCAKNILAGDFKEPARKQGATSDIVIDQSVVGKAVRTREGSRPVFISVGYDIALGQAVETILAFCRGHRIPEPLRYAHALAIRSRQEGPGH